MRLFVTSVLSTAGLMLEAALLLTPVPAAPTGPVMPAEGSAKAAPICFSSARASCWAVWPGGRTKEKDT